MPCQVLVYRLSQQWTWDQNDRVRAMATPYLHASWGSLLPKGWSLLQRTKIAKTAETAGMSSYVTLVNFYLVIIWLNKGHLLKDKPILGLLWPIPILFLIFCSWGVYFCLALLIKWTWHKSNQKQAKNLQRNYATLFVHHTKLLLQSL